MTKQTLDIRTAQVLTMTPRLQQAIKLLQLSQQELCTYINEQLLENPLLVGQDTDLTVPLDAPQDYENAYEEDYNRDSLVFQTHSNSAVDSLANLARQEISLRDHLMQQLAIAVTDPVLSKLGEHLIDSINSYGFLDEDVASISQRFNIPIDMVAGLLATLQTFDPPGVFAKNLADCFAIQLKEQGMFSKNMESLLTNLDLLTQMPFKTFAKKVGVGLEECQNLLNALKTLCPRPIQNFDHTPINVVVPDVYVKYCENTGWGVALNQKTLPKIFLDNQYYESLREKVTSRDERSYINAQYSHAHWLLNAIEQRTSTLLRVAQEVINQQKGFLEFGFSEFKPLSLRQVADALDIHESTVSRITTSKYIATPRGIFDLKFFFSSGVKQQKRLIQKEDTTSSRTIQEKIRELVAKENPKDPLSDDALVEQLMLAGLTVARRTITKYRKILKIPSSFERKRHYDFQKNMSGFSVMAQNF